MIGIWLKNGLIDSTKFQKIQEIVDNVAVPNDVGRIPRKIETGFSGFKADQFKTWITLYSIPALFDILSSEHLECWRHFVLACRILSQRVFSPQEIDILRKHYTLLHPDHEGDSNVVVNSIFLKYLTVTVNGKDYQSTGKRTNTAVVAMSSWNNTLYGNPSTSLLGSTRPINIHYFIKVLYTVNDITSSSLYAYATWFFPHPDRNAYGKPVELWCHNFYEPFGMHSFVPVDDLTCRCAHGTFKHHDENVLLVVPLVE